jgi:hypothetical protein
MMSLLFLLIAFPIASLILLIVGICLAVAGVGSLQDCMGSGEPVNKAVFAGALIRIVVGVVMTFPLIMLGSFLRGF